jgi:DNA-binding transcriptional ArsR family regulator
MESKAAILSLAALAHDTRLNLFRALIRAGEAGLPAGELAGALNVAPSTLSHHLAQLEQAGLIRSHRQSRHIFYHVDAAQIRDLIGFLVDDCCAGHPDLCDLGRGEAC